jgi:hypothetical protein
VHAALPSARRAATCSRRSATRCRSSYESLPKRPPLVCARHTPPARPHEHTCVRARAHAADRTVVFTRRSDAGVTGLLDRADSSSSSRAVDCGAFACACECGCGVDAGALRRSLVGVLGRSSSGCRGTEYGDLGRSVPTAGPAFSLPPVPAPRTPLPSPESVRFGAGSRRLTFSGVFAKSVERAFWPDMAARSRPLFGERERPLVDATVPPTAVVPPAATGCKGKPRAARCRNAFQAAQLAAGYATWVRTRPFRRRTSAARRCGSFGIREGEGEPRSSGPRSASRRLRSISRAQ